MSYDLWEQELATPGSVDRLTDNRLHWGFWRNAGPRTEHDTPVAIWGDDSGSLIKWGRKDPIPLSGPNEERWSVWAYHKAIAVTEADYTHALLTGEWPDGKRSRATSDTPLADAIAKPGESNFAPVHEVITERIRELLDQITALGALDTQEKADKATEIGIRLKAAMEEGDVAADKERKPFADKLAEVNERWKVLFKLSDKLTDLRQSVRAFLKRENDRLAEEARKAAEATKAKDPVPPSGDVAEAPAATPSPPVAAPAVRPAYGRAVTLRTVRRGRITDFNKFLKVVAKDVDLIALVQKKADAFARAQSAKPGMEIIQTKE